MEKTLDELIEEANEERDELAEQEDNIDDNDNNQDDNSSEENSGEDNNSEESTDADDTKSGDDDKSDEAKDKGDDDSAKDVEDDEQGDNSIADDDSGDNNDNDSNNNDNDTSFESFEVTVGNTVVKIDSKEDMIKLAQRGLDVKEAEPKSVFQEMAEQGNLSTDDLTLLIDAKNGDANAIARLAEVSGVNLNEDAMAADEYQSNFQVQQETDIDRVAGAIMKDEAHANAFRETVSRVPKSFAEQISSDAGMLQAFSNHIRSGLAEQAIAQATVQVAKDGGDFFQAYATAGRALAEAGSKTKNTEDRNMSDAEKNMRKRANQKGNSNKTKKSDANDIWDMSDEDFEKERHSLMK